jgi:hypothetical protein
MPSLPCRVGGSPSIKPCSVDMASLFIRHFSEPNPFFISQAVFFSPAIALEHDFS